MHEKGHPGAGRAAAAVCAALLWSLTAAAFDWPSLSHRVERGLAYGRGHVQNPPDAKFRTLHFNLITPRGRAQRPRPAVVLIHGGGFKDGGPDDRRLEALAKRLVREGYVCFLMEYRLMGDAPPAPSPYDEDLLKSAAHAAAVDASAMLRFIAARAADFAVDPARIALLGESAGAVTALAVGLAEPGFYSSDGPGRPVPEENHPATPMPRPAAIINLWGTADFFPELFSAGDPPIMTVHGAKDTTVGLSLLPAENIDALCAKHGIPHTYYPLPDAGHGAFDAEVGGRDLAALSLEFLDRHLRGHAGEH